MGRELKRVPLDFDWPIDKTWSGYLNPHYEQCNTCKGRGSTLAMLRLGDLVSLLMLSGDDARRGRCHPYFNEASLFDTRGRACGPEMAALTQALAGRESSSLFGHDSCDRWSATRKIVRAAGMPEGWGTCPDCDGQGIPRDKFQAYEEWEQIEPPEGPGFQIWETVSEGSPISPVFATAEDLAQHMATTRWGGDQGTSVESWLKFILRGGSTVSMVRTSDGELLNGVEAAARES